MTTVHDWKHSKACKSVDLYGLRKPHTWKNGPPSKKQKLNIENGTEIDGKVKKTWKNYHKKRLCPMIGCMSVNTRMSLHLQDVHRVEKGTKRYYDFLREALPFTERNMDEVHTVRKSEIFRSQLLKVVKMIVVMMASLIAPINCWKNFLSTKCQLMVVLLKLNQ